MDTNRFATSLQKTTMHKVSMRIVPFAIIAFLISYIDRINIGFAALQMNDDLAISPAAYGLAGGLFFLAYCFFEVPSNILMEKFGAKIWLTRIMITWGIISLLMAFVTGPHSLYLIRVLLGAAEAGLFPGLLLYFTYWFPSEYRARVISLLFMATPIASIIGSPVSAVLLETEGWMGMHGWQWLFIAEAIPAILLGVFTFFFVVNKPVNARWLSAEEKAWLMYKINEESGKNEKPNKKGFLKALLNKSVVILSLVYAGSSSIVNGLTLWLPQVIKSFQLSNMYTGMINSLLFLMASLGMVWWGHHSDRTGERSWHTSLPLALAAISLASFTFFSSSLTMAFIVLCITLAATYAAKAPFWALASKHLSSSSAAVGLAAINALGNLGGFGGSYMIGLIKGQTGSFTYALWPLVILLVISVALVLYLKKTQQGEDASLYDHAIKTTEQRR